MKKTSLGVIGLSEGNGHPYSWSAICNGFDMNYMKDCPFPVIPEYLSKEKYPGDFIQDANVTHIWTQDRTISEHVAKASKIGNIVTDYHDMIGKVDAILLARDDAENHLEMCRDFIEAGMMVYIDKPLAFSTENALKIFKLEKFPGQVFSCSAMRYAKELRNGIDKIKTIGKINYIDACVMKRWDTYSAHIIDPMLMLLDDKVSIREHISIKNDFAQGVILKLVDGMIINLMSHKNENSPMYVNVFGEYGNVLIEFDDTFYAFRETLKQFIISVKNRKSVISKDHMLKLVDIINRGNQ